MKNEIEIINAYINQTLTGTERLALAKRLQSDESFELIYEEQLVFLRGLERISLKDEIAGAKKSYLNRKWLRKGFTIAFILGTLFLIWMLLLNNKSTPKNELRTLLNFETELIQKFEVSTDSIIEITGKKGTQLIINREDLEFESGENLTDEQLKIELMELTNRQDLLLANAQTKSNGKWLISGGAFKIEIKANGKTLRLKGDKTLNCKFPKNTQEEQMQLFYGNRNENGYLNWEPTDVEIRNEQQFVIFCRDTMVLDKIVTRMYGGVETFKTFLKVDTLGYLTSDNILKKFPNLKKVQNQKDTLTIYKELLNEEEDEILGYSILDDDLSNFMQKKYSDSVLSIYGSDSKRMTDNFEEQNAFYESVQISKLGWINIDQFTKYADLATLTLENNIGFDFNTFTEEAYNHKSTWHETYLIDQKNNTVLSVYSSQLDIPKNRAFTILSCAILDDKFYVCRKAINLLKNSNVTLDYKKRNKTQIRSLLKL